MRLVLRVLSLVLLVGLGVTLIVQNQEPIPRLDLVITTFTNVPVWQPLLISLLVGAGVNTRTLTVKSLREAPGRGCRRPIGMPNSY